MSKVLFSLFFFLSFSALGKIPEPIKASISSVLKVYVYDPLSINHTHAEGTAFFIGENKVLTSFHAIAPLYQNDHRDLILISTNGQVFKLKNIEKTSPIHDIATLNITPILKEEYPKYFAKENIQDIIKKTDKIKKEVSEFLLKDLNSEDKTTFVNKDSEPFYAVGFAKNRFNILKVEKQNLIKNSLAFITTIHQKIPGMSGGPIFDKNGKAIAVMKSKSHNYLFAEDIKYSEQETISCNNQSDHIDSCIQLSLNYLYEKSQEGHKAAKEAITLYSFSNIYNKTFYETVDDVDSIGVLFILYTHFDYDENVLERIVVLSEQRHPIAQYVLALLLFCEQVPKDSNYYYPEKIDDLLIESYGQKFHASKDLLDGIHLLKNLPSSDKKQHQKKEACRITH